MFSNFMTAIASSTGITLALFYVMQMLISMQPGATVEPAPPFKPRWVRVPEPEDPPLSQWEYKPNPIDDPPPVPDPVSDDFGSEITIAVPGNPPSPPRSGNGVVTFEMSDSMLVNVVRVQPVYPAIAEARGLAGYVVVQFDVMANGTVTNVAIVESSNRVFDKSAKDAAKRFRYRARVVDGVPQPSYGIRYAFRFNMK